MATLPADRTKLALAQSNQNPQNVLGSSQNKNAITEIYDTVDLLNNVVSGLVSSAGLSRLGIINVKDYNASGSSQTTTGSIASGSTMLTLAAAKDFANGQGITVAGAGAVGALLVTTIVSGAGTLNLVLAAAASTTVSAVTVNHDDSAAIQAAINAAKNIPTFAAENTGGLVYIPSGVYQITTALDLTNNAGVSLMGYGKTKSNLVMATGLTTLININGNNYRGSIKGLRLTGQVGQLAGTAINTTGTGNQIYVEDCWINNFQYGIYCNPSSDSNFLNNVYEYVQTPIYISGSNDIQIAHSMFYNCGPVSGGGGEFNPTFWFINSSRINFFKNRFVTDTTVSAQSGGILKIDSCTDVNIEGIIENAATTTVGRSVVLIASVRVHIINNHFGLSYFETLKLLSGANKDIIIKGNSFQGTKNAAYPSMFASGAYDGVLIEGNTFTGSTNTYDLSADTGANTFVSENKFDKGYNLDQGLFRVIIGTNMNGAVSNYLTAPPLYGTWKLGDFVPNPSPSELGAAASKYIIRGWRCVVAGGPGTWVQERALTGN